MTRWSSIWIGLAIDSGAVNLIQACLLWWDVQDHRLYVACWIAKMLIDFGMAWLFRMRTQLPAVQMERQLGQIWLFFWFSHFLTYWFYQRTGGSMVGFLPIISVESALVLVAMAAIVGGSFYVAAALCVIAALLQSQWPVVGQSFSLLLIAPLFFWLGWKHRPRKSS